MRSQPFIHLETVNLHGACEHRAKLGDNRKEHVRYVDSVNQPPPEPFRQTMTRLISIILTCLLVSSCATRLPALPVEYAKRLPWGAVDPDSGLTVGIDHSIQKMGSGQMPPDTDGDGKPNYTLLLVSGGGAKGAFGAGVLKGWSELGSRPDFTIVTGVSTGALMSTWVFLGSDQDPALQRFYTRTSNAQIFRRRNILSAMFGDSILDTTPLHNTLAAAIDESMLDAVAAEYRRGRRLYVASTDLDNNRLVVWDLGAIAASGHPDRLKRYHDALIASASIPVGFPPVYFSIDVDGQRYSQMHVDGGAVANFLLTGFILDRQKAMAAAPVNQDTVNADLYLLLNNQLTPQAPTRPVNPTLVSIAAAASWATSWSAQTSQMVRAYRAANGIGMGFHLAGIPDDYDGPLPIVGFVPDEMQALFEFGQSRAKSAGFWLQAPPGIDPREHPDD